ncbi:hypothetical protein C6990_05930, partial [Nitrosopumilus sp. b3]|uniref:fibro-slime domain-containing protein n=1 Tax=Nitrosopumilus sp. b3 TaxID=2109909 RepID=UPI0015F3EF81
SIPTFNEDLNSNGDWFDDDTDGDGIPTYLDNDDDADGFVGGIGLGFDCNDVDASINPDANEIWGDDIDNNCDDDVDESYAVNDSYDVDGDSGISIPAPGVLDNDQYDISMTVSIIETSIPSPGLLVNSDGSFVFTPSDLFFGTVSFTYVILDEDGVTQSNESTVTLTQSFCGNDVSLYNVIEGTNGNDKLKGTDGNDLILGLDGNDKINAKKGDDCIYGGDGKDNINGHDGMDEIHGGSGDDKIRGHAGDDIIFGDAGNDNLTGNNGLDEIHGGDGNDKITGNNHDDRLFGDAGNDKIGGGNGDDFIDGGDNYDYCKGNKGDNTIINCEKGDSNTETGDQKQLTGIIRDFKKNHDDMEQGCSGGLCSSVEPGIVKSVLGGDGKPEFNQDTISTNGQANFVQWYNDVNGVNKSDDITLTLDNTITSDPSVYTFESGPGFFPIDGKLFGNQGLSHNYHFTIEFHSTIEFENDQMFKFTGDDDVWVFIDDKLVIDLGGVHPKSTAEITSTQLINDYGLQTGETYDIDIFFAERQTVQSNFRIDTSMGMS